MVNQNLALSLAKDVELLVYECNGKELVCPLLHNPSKPQLSLLCFKNE